MTGDTRQSETAAAVDTIAEENIPRPYHPDHWRPIAYRVIDIQGCYLGQVSTDGYHDWRWSFHPVEQGRRRVSKICENPEELLPAWTRARGARIDRTRDLFASSKASGTLTGELAPETGT